MVAKKRARERGYKMRRDDEGKLRKVVVIDGREGYYATHTGDCFGCTEYGEYGVRYGGGGCEECGYTGKRRSRYWMPFHVREAEPLDEAV